MTSRPYVALGLMSGTSLDGVDAAFLQTDGEQIFRFGPSLSLPYAIGDRQILRETIAAALEWQFQGTPPNIFSSCEAVLQRTHKHAVQTLCRQAPEWARDLELIGFHGQTVLHHPPEQGKKGQTLQLGNGERLSESLGVPVIYDFRTADMAAGGQGAPLAPVYHKALMLKAGEACQRPVAILNIGGVANVTLITRSDGREAFELLASDTGPGNGPLDSWMMQNDAGAYDKDGLMALTGTPHDCVRSWLEREFFLRPIPRSADRYDFDVLEDIGGLSLEDGAATLANFTVQAIVETLKLMSRSTQDSMPRSLIVCGGGRHNQGIMQMLADNLSVSVRTAEDMGWESDAIEAQAFAFLAVRSILGLALSYPGTTGVCRAMTGGRRSTALLL